MANKVKKEGFLLYKNMYGAVSWMSAEQKGKLFDAIFAWQLSGGEYPEVDDPAVNAALMFFINQFNIDESKYRQVSDVRRDAVGARWKDGETEDPDESDESEPMRTDANACKSIQTDTNDTKVYKPIQTIQKYTDKDKDKDLDLDHDKDIQNPPNSPNGEYSPLPGETAPKASRKKFAKPTVEEVEAYCMERGNAVDARTFWDFYESKGWMIGRNPMKDWRAAVRTWERDRGGGGAGGRPARDRGGGPVVAPVAAALEENERTMRRLMEKARAELGDDELKQLTRT